MLEKAFYNMPCMTKESNKLMENVLLHAVKDTVFIGGEPEKDAFHIALTGTADYIPHMGIVTCGRGKGTSGGNGVDYGMPCAGSSDR